MIFGAVLAGGKGTRMGNVDKPKQFLTIGGKPIIVHTVEKFVMNDKFEKVIVLCPEQWISYTKDLFRKYLPDGSRVEVIQGGAVRNETIMNAIRYIEENYGLDEDTIMVTHDAVRPFVTHRIIEENIEKAQQGVICDTVIPATDTIVESRDGAVISAIPDRKFYYQGLTNEEREILTDAAKVFVMKGEKVTLVQGETFNIKVTYPYDLQLAETLLGGEKKC